MNYRSLGKGEMYKMCFKYKLNFRSRAISASNRVVTCPRDGQEQRRPFWSSQLYGSLQSILLFSKVLVCSKAGVPGVTSNCPRWSLHSLGPGSSYRDRSRALTLFNVDDQGPQIAKEDNPEGSFGS